MLTWNEPKVEVVHCDNGYVVEWRDERRSGVMYGDGGPPTHGVKIFSTKKEMLKFLETFFGGK
jgi:hypothetical protein